MVTEAQVDEAWKPIPGYEDVYEVSSAGTVRRLTTVSATGRRWKGRELKATPAGGGYLSVTLSLKGDVRTHAVHVLVCRSFHGEGKPGEEAAHLDGKKFNNRSSNLTWATPKQNHAHRVGHGTILSGADHPRTILTSSQVDEIRKIHSEKGWGYKRVARFLGLNENATLGVLRGTAWRHYAQ